MKRRLIVTGGAGFIGSALVRLLIQETDAEVLVIDKLTYAGVPANLAEVGLNPETLTSSTPRLQFLKADICDQEAMTHAFETFRPTGIFHLAAESHVDRSIDGPMAFIETNIVGTANLLQVALAYWRTLPESGEDLTRENFRFQHISTDEVYGTLGSTGYFTETTPYAPHSPYSASKASSDHLVRAWHDTFGLPTLITNCSNNYGPYHFPEKLIPLVILNALDGKPLPIYGTGAQIRDWLYVEDHARALWLVHEKGAAGSTYNIGGHNERTNAEVVKTICRILDVLRPRSDGRSYAELITHVADRPGHDLRYAIDPTRLTTELGWQPHETFDTGIKRTVDWYLTHEAWWKPLREHYNGARLGKGGR